MDGWKLGGGNTGLQFEREDGKAVMLDDLIKPLLRRTGQLEFSFGRLDGDFKTADG